MKYSYTILFALAFALGLFNVAKADTHQVTSLTTSAVATIVVVPNNAQWVTFTNMGAGAVNIVLDGGAATGYSNTDPTTGATGIAQIVIPAASGGTPGTITLYVPSFFQGAVVRGIMQSGTTTLNVGVGMPKQASVPSGTFPIN